MAEVKLSKFVSNIAKNCEIENKIAGKGNLKISLFDENDSVLAVVSLYVSIPQFFEKKAKGSLVKKTSTNKDIIETNYEMKIELLNSIKADLSKQKHSLEEMLAEERKYIESLENKIHDMNKDYADSMKRSQERDSQLMQKLNMIMKENTELQRVNCRLNNDDQEKENAIFYLKENLNKLKLVNSASFAVEYKKRLDEITELYYKSEKERDSLQLVIKGSDEVAEKIIKSSNSSSCHLEAHNKALLKDIKDLQDELKFYRLQHSQSKIEEETRNSQATSSEALQKKSEKVKTLKTTLQSLQNDLLFTRAELSSFKSQLSISKLDLDSAKTEICDFSKRISSLEGTKERLELELIQLKCSSLKSLKEEKLKLDDIDKMLNKYFSDQSLENLFVKISSGLYVYGTRKVNVMIKKGNLICKENGIYMFIDEFIKRDEGFFCRSSSIYSPLSGLKESFVMPSRVGKTNSLVSHLVSPRQGMRLGFSADFDREERTIERNFQLSIAKKKEMLQQKYG